MYFSVRTVPLILSLAVLLSSCGNDNQQRERQIEVLNSAYRVNDFEAAAVALHNLIALAPNERTWRDSLALTYFRARKFEQAFAASRVSLGSANKEPNEQLLRVAAESSKVLGLNDESLKAHLRLLEFTPKDAILLYDIGLLYYSLLKLDVGIQYMDRVLKIDAARNLKLVVRTSSGEQEVGYWAAAHNAKGYALTELGKLDDAEQELKQALILEPSFLNAQENLQYCLSKKK